MFIFNVWEINPQAKLQLGKTRAQKLFHEQYSVSGPHEKGD